MYSQLKAWNSRASSDGPGGGFGAVDLAEGHDLADMQEDVEPPFGQPLVEGLGLGGQGQQPLEQLLIAGPAALLEQGPGMVGILEVLVAVVAADVAGQEFVLLVDAQVIGVDLEGQMRLRHIRRAPSRCWCPGSRGTGCWPAPAGGLRHRRDAPAGVGGRVVRPGTTPRVYAWCCRGGGRWPRCPATAGRPG